ncbi:4-aminobutyrate--2-oxoglutarate transaminase [Methylobacterium sp. A54F]
MHNHKLSARRASAISSGIGTVTQVYVDRALNSEIWDVEGRRYIDFAAGIAVVNTGHGHPRIIQAVTQQIERFTHTCHQVIPYESYVSLAERLNGLVPGSAENKTVFVTTGAEAVENAIKIARAATKRTAVIAFGGGFHGRTFMGMALTGKVHPYKAGFGTMMPDVYHVPFPSEIQGVSVQLALEMLDRLFKADVDPSRVAAFLIEPVQGEGGFHEAPKNFMTALRELADRHGILLIADEVQTGFARTGKMFAMEHHDVRADLTTMAKGLGGGFPIAAVTGRADLMDAPATGGLGGTYGGSPIGVAAGHAVLDVIADEQLCDRAFALGSRLKQHLQSLREDVPQIAEVRGPGFMNAVEFHKPDSGTPDPEFTAKIRSRALDRGLILLSCGVYGNVIRFLAPLTIQDEVFAEALDILGASVRDCAAEG